MYLFHEKMQSSPNVFYLPHRASCNISYNIKALIALKALPGKQLSAQDEAVAFLARTVQRRIPVMISTALSICPIVIPQRTVPS